MKEIKITSNGHLSISREDLLRQMKICFVLNRKWFKKYLQKDFEDEQLLTSSEVMKLLKISSTTFFRRVRDGKLVPIDKDRRPYRFLKSEVNNLIKHKEDVR